MSDLGHVLGFAFRQSENPGSAPQKSFVRCPVVNRTLMVKVASMGAATGMLLGLSAAQSGGSSGVTLLSSLAGSLSHEGGNHSYGPYPHPSPHASFLPLPSPYPWHKPVPTPALPTPLSTEPPTDPGDNPLTTPEPPSWPAPTPFATERPYPSPTTKPYPSTLPSEKPYPY